MKYSKSAFEWGGAVNIYPLFFAKGISRTQVGFRYGLWVDGVLKIFFVEVIFFVDYML